mmetsp:Transcript_8739/g.13407  ORF Transcript_8739/g.13407 Transcript_8739/m.13407 type:complete len:943 (+) Transcript_8739:94-2922(+)
MGINPSSTSEDTGKDDSNHVKAIEEGNAPPVKEEAAPKGDTSKNNKYRIVFAVVAVLVVVSLIVGLSVGLRKDDDSSDPHYNTGNSGTNDPGTVDDVTSTDPPTGNNNNNNNNDDSNNTTQPPIASADAKFYRSSNLLKVQIPLLTADSEETSDDTNHTAFQALVKNAALFISLNALQRNLRVPGYQNVAIGGGGRGTSDIDGIPFVEENLVGDAADTVEAGPQPTAGAGPPSSEKQEVDPTDQLNDFGTNNQEQFVDEASQMKSDGSYVYAAYGNQIQIFDTEAKQQEAYQMNKPDVNCTSNGYDDIVFVPEPIIEVVPPTETEVDTVDMTASTASGASTKSIAYPGFYFCPEANVRSLLLTKDRLIAFVSGYEREVKEDILKEEGGDESEPYILYDYAGTRMFVFDTTQVETEGLVLMGTQDMHGSFESARVVDNVIHAVLITGINTWQPLIQPIEKWNFPTLTLSEYNATVLRKIETELVTAFTDRLTNEMFDTKGGRFPVPDHTVGPSMWSQQVSNDAHEESIIWGDGVMNSYVSVNSLDMNLFLEAQDDGKLPVVSSGAFFSSSWILSYANEDMLTLGGRGYQYDPDKSAHVPTTFLMGFKFQGNGLAAIPVATGAVPGYPLNPYSFDQVGNNLRVATTIRSWWVRRAENLWRDGPIMDFTLPETQNQIVVLELPEDSNKWVEVGRTPNLGKKGETITACRFFDNFAYVVTFRRTDPFYVVDLSNKTATEIPVPGELSISGFSEYLHPMNSMETMLLAIGQEADEDGVVLGLQLTIFNATDPAKPEDIHRYVVENETDVYSSSSAQFSPHAFRYVPISPDLGLDGNIDGFLIIPLTQSSWQPWPENDGSKNFDGYVVYTISVLDGIQEHMKIPHGNADNWDWCYSNNVLVDRSFVFEGNVMTTKRHSVKLTDLGDKSSVGGFTIVEKNENNCHPWIG